MNEEVWIRGVKRVIGQHQTGYYAPEEFTAALTAIGAQIVPIVATEAMQNAIMHARHDHSNYDNAPVWDAGREAAPKVIP